MVSHTQGGASAAGESRTNPFLALDRAEQIKASPLSSSEIEECEESSWKSTRICKHNGSERMTEDYREILKLVPPSQTQPWSVEETTVTDGWGHDV